MSKMILTNYRYSKNNDALTVTQNSKSDTQNSSQTMSEEAIILINHGKEMQKIGLQYALEMAKIDPENIVSILEDKIRRIENEN